MPTYRCECGAKYRFPDSAIGKKAKCKKCSAVFSIEEEEAEPIPLAGEGQGTRSAEAPPLGMAFQPGPEFEIATTQPVPSSVPQLDGELTSDPIAAPPTPARGYGDSLLWTFLFLASPRSLFMFVAAWFLLTLAAVMPWTLAFAVTTLVALWYAGFRFSVIESAANGEDGIPLFAFSGDVLQELVFPVFRWLGSWVVVMLPAFLYIVLLSGWTGDEKVEAFKSLVLGLNELFQDFGSEVTLIILVCGGLFVWPIIVLSIAIGGFTVVYRFDLMLVTIFRSLPPYLLTLAIVAAATAGKSLIFDAIQTGIGPFPTLGGTLKGDALYNGVRLYCDIVMLRAIGLYYHHFKHRFAWSWG